MHARAGLNANMRQVAEEFTQHNNLQPLKILVTGPPCSGKSTFADYVGHQYSLPVIRASNLLAAASNLQPPDAAAVEQALKGGKTGSGRVPPDLMAKLGRLVLSGVPARNRGFILDGFPKTLREARELFTDPRDWSQDELNVNAEIEAALSSNAPAALGMKGGTPGKSDAKLAAATTAKKAIDDVPEPRKILAQFMPDAVVKLFHCRTRTH